MIKKKSFPTLSQDGSEHFMKVTASRPGRSTLVSFSTWFQHQLSVIDFFLHSSVFSVFHKHYVIKDTQKSWIIFIFLVVCRWLTLQSIKMFVSVYYWGRVCLRVRYAWGVTTSTTITLSRVNWIFWGVCESARVINWNIARGL